MKNGEPSDFFFGFFILCAVKWSGKYKKLWYSLLTINVRMYIWMWMCIHPTSIYACVSRKHSTSAQASCLPFATEGLWSTASAARWWVIWPPLPQCSRASVKRLIVGDEIESELSMQFILYQGRKGVSNAPTLLSTDQPVTAKGRMGQDPKGEPCNISRCCSEDLHLIHSYE